MKKAAPAQAVDSDSEGEGEEEEESEESAGVPWPVWVVGIGLIAGIAALWSRRRRS